MTRKTNSELMGRILELYQFLPSSRKIQKNLVEKGIKVSHTTITRIVAADQDKEKGKHNKKKAKNPGKPIVRTKALINKVAEAVNTKDPPSHRDISCKHGIAKGTVGRIQKEDLGLIFKKKRKTHKLTPQQAEQRLERGPGFRRLLSRRKLPYILSIDETMVTMNDADGQ